MIGGCGGGQESGVALDSGSGSREKEACALSNMEQRKIPTEGGRDTETTAHWHGDKMMGRG